MPDPEWDSIGSTNTEAPAPEWDSIGVPSKARLSPYDARAAFTSLYPKFSDYVTSQERSSTDPLSRKNPGSYHVDEPNAIDVRPIPGVRFSDFVKSFETSGHKIVESRDEQANPMPWTTGPNWHIVLSGGPDHKAPLNAPAQAPEWDSIGAPTTPSVDDGKPSDGPATVNKTLDTVMTSRGDTVSEDQSPDRIAVSDVQAKGNQSFQDMTWQFGKDKTLSKVPLDAAVNKIVEEGKKNGVTVTDTGPVKQWLMHYRSGGVLPMTFTDPTNTVGDNEITVTGQKLPENSLEAAGHSVYDTIGGTLEGSADAVKALAESGLRLENNLGLDNDKLLYDINLQKARKEANGLDPLSETYYNPSGTSREVGKFVGENLPYVAIPMEGAPIRTNAVIGAMASPDAPVVGGILGGTMGGLGHVGKLRGEKPWVTPTDNPLDIQGAIDTGVLPEDVQMTSRGKIHKDFVQKKVNDLSAGWTNSPDVKVVQGFRGLPEDLRAQMKADGAQKAEAVIDKDGKIHILADNITNPDRIQPVLFHEALGHTGLKNVFSDGLDNILDDIYRTNHNIRNAADEYLKKRDGIYEGRSPQTRATEEVLAMMSENGKIDPSVMDRLVTYIREFGRDKLGLDLRMNDREVRILLSKAHDNIVNGGDIHQGGNGVRYMYIGEKGALTADPHNVNSSWDFSKDTPEDLAHAQDMKDRGYDVGPDGKTRLATGWFEGPDGKWRREITDHRAEATEHFWDNVDENGNHQPMRLGDVLKHDELYRHYPEAKDIILRDDPQWGAHGSQWKNDIRVSPDAPDWMGTLHHEIQHWVQDKEGFARGGSPDRAVEKMSDAHLARVTGKVIDWLEGEKKAADTKARAYKNFAKDPLAQEYYDANRNFHDDYDSLSQDVKTVRYRRLRSAENALFEKYLGSSNIREITKNPEYKDFNKLLHDFGAKRHQDYNPFGKVLSQPENIRELQDTLGDALDDHGNLIDRRTAQSVLNKNEHVPFQAYEHLFGEVEARDTAHRVGFDEQQRWEKTPYTAEDHIEPNDYIIDTEKGLDITKPSSEEGPRYSLPEKDRKAEKVAKDKIGNLSADKINSTEDIRRIMDEAADGVHIPESLTHEDVRILAERSGITPAKLLKKNPQLADPVVLMKAKMLVESTGKDVSRLAEALQSADGKIGDLERFRTALLRHGAMMEWLMRAANHAGRALNILGARTSEGVLARIGDTAHIAALDDSALYSIAKNVSMNADNPLAVSKIAKDSAKPYFEDYISSFRYSMMLSGLPTHIKNALGNATLMAVNLVEHGGASIIGQWKRFTAGERVLAREAGMRSYGMLKALMDSKTYRDAAQSYIDRHPVHSVSKVEGGENLLGPLDAPKGALAASDSFFRSILENGDFYGIAMRNASKEGKKGAEFWDRVDELIQNPTKEMVEHADQQAAELQLVDEPSALGKWIENAKSRPARTDKNMVGKRALRFALQIALPFTRVTDRLFWTAVRRSPLAFTDRLWRARIAEGGAARDLAIAQMTMGTAAIGYFYNLAQDGKITGDGPKDFKKKAALEATGWKPNSIKKDDGTYVSLSGLDAVSVLANTTATLVERYKAGEVTDDDGAIEGTHLSTAIASQLSNNTFTAQLGDFVYMFSGSPQGDNAFENFAASTAVSFLPTPLKQYNQKILDPILRDTSGDGSLSGKVYGRILGATPEFSKDLPVRHDIFGREIKRSGETITGMFQTGKSDPDPVSHEVFDLSEKTGKILISPVDRGTIKYIAKKPDAAQVQQAQEEIGKNIHDSLLEWIKSPEWKGMTTEDKAKTIKEVQSYWRKDYKERNSVDATAGP